MMKCHRIEYSIQGDDTQLVEVELQPGGTVIAEAGMMAYIESGIRFTAKMGDGADPDAGLMEKLVTAGRRALAKESIFMTHFHNTSSSPRKVGFSAPHPGKIIPLDLKKLGGSLICQKDAFLCAAHGTKLSIAFQKRLGPGFFGGEGFILQELRGDGMVFIQAGGTVLEKELKGETLRVDPGRVVGCTAGVAYDIELAGDLKSLVFGGEGTFLASLRGHGTVWIQSLPFSRLADRILAQAPPAKPVKANKPRKGLRRSPFRKKKD